MTTQELREDIERELKEWAAAVRRKHGAATSTYRMSRLRAHIEILSAVERYEKLLDEAETAHTHAQYWATPAPKGPPPKCPTCGVAQVWTKGGDPFSDKWVCPQGCEANETKGNK